MSETQVLTVDTDVKKRKPKGFYREKTPPKKPKQIYMDQLICFAALTAMAVWKSGVRAIIIVAVSIAFCMLSDYICCRLSRKTYNPKDLSTFATGFCIALMMPASIDYGLVVFGAALAMGVKHIFGGKDNYIFNPACVSLAFLVICYPEKMLLYPKAGAELELWGTVTAPLSSGLESFLMKMGTAQTLSTTDVLLGNFLGPIGTTHVLVLTVCSLVLLCRRSLSLSVTLSGLAAFAAGSLLFPLYENISNAIIVELISGYLLFGFIFLASDPQTIPKTVFGRLLYGTLIGVLAVVFRHFGKVEAGFVFVLLLANAISVHIDRFAEGIIQNAKKAFHFVKSHIGTFEKVKDDAQSGKTPKLTDTMEIIVPPTNYNMPPIDNKVTKINRRKWGFTGKSEEKPRKKKPEQKSFMTSLREEVFHEKHEKSRDAVSMETRLAESYHIKQPRKTNDKKKKKKG